MPPPFQRTRYHPARVQLELPACLTARQRAVLHALAEQHGLGHGSSGEGGARRLTLGPAAAPAAPLPPGLAEATAVSDEQLAALLRQHLGIDAAPALAQPPPGPAASAVRPAQPARAAAAPAVPGAAGLVSVEEYVAATLPLLELERGAEVAAAEGVLAACSPEAAQARGAALLNLRLVDAEGGLLGRTLLTLVNNKVRAPRGGEGAGGAQRGWRDWWRATVGACGCLPACLPANLFCQQKKTWPAAALSSSIHFLAGRRLGAAAAAQARPARHSAPEAQQGRLFRRAAGGGRGVQGQGGCAGGGG